MQLEVHDRAARDRDRHADCLFSRPRVRGDPTAESFSASRPALASPSFERAITSWAISIGSTNTDPLTRRNPTRGRGDLSVDEASAFTNRGGSAAAGRRRESRGTVGFRDATGSVLVTAPSAPGADTQAFPGLFAIGEGSATYWERFMTIEGKTVLVTGANRGIGRALVEEALSRGARRVYAGTRHPFVHPDQRVTPLMLDVTSPA